LIRREVPDSEPTYLRCEYCGNVGKLEHGMLHRRWAGRSVSVHKACWPDYVATGGQVDDPDGMESPEAG
jgi:hypothetical protein